jgi:hypothetical protein
MAAIYSNGGNNWNILGFSLTKRDALSSVYKISMVGVHRIVIFTIRPDTGFAGYPKKIRPDTGYFINLKRIFLIHVLVQKTVTLFFKIFE